MRIKFLNGIITVDILTILLAVIIGTASNTVLRVILGLPFVLLFPGYTLMAALFPHRDKMGRLEKWIMSFGMSIPIVALLGLGLNYTPWGISLNSILFSLVCFIVVMSIIATIRGRPAELIAEFNLKFSGGQGGFLDHLLSFILIITIVSAVGILVYTVAIPKIGERFTEFYYLGLEHKAEAYPVEFNMQNGEVTGVKYSDQNQVTADSEGKITLGVVNQEQAAMSYLLTVKVDGEQVNITYAGQSTAEVGPLDLTPGRTMGAGAGVCPDAYR